MSLNIIKRCAYTNLTRRPNRPIEWLAIHYTAGITSKKGAAQSTAAWFADQRAQASADFIVDDVEIVQYNPDPANYNCWAVGGGKYSNSKGGRLYGTVYNCNSISIEICSTNDAGKMTSANDGHYHFTDAAIDRAVELTRYLMDKYHIDADHVIRHYDVNGKWCPGIIGWNADSGSEKAWEAFKKRLTEEEIDMTKEELEQLIDQRVEAKLTGKDTKPSKWAEAELAEAVARGITDGTNPKGYTTREQTAAMVLRSEKRLQALMEKTGEGA